MRCPYCHADVDLAGDEWLACEGCLARHHAACFEEHGRCSACGYGGALGRVVRRDRRVVTIAIAGALSGFAITSWTLSHTPARTVLRCFNSSASK